MTALLACPVLGAPARPKDVGFLGVSNRIITPNGDGKNDDVTFKFTNPHAASGSVTIYSLRGHQVASIPIGATDQSVTWATPQSTASGVYIYVIELDGSVVSGALVVIK